MFDYKKKDLNMKRELEFILAKTLSMFRYEGLPETIPQRDLERQLQTKGYAFFTEYKGDLYSFTDGLGGEPDPYGNPTQIVIANPALGFNKTLDLKEDGVLMNNDSMRNGLKHLLEKYIYMLNENEISMVVNSFNSRMPTLISAGDDNTRESAEQYLKKVIDGDLGVIAENRLFEGINAQSTGAGTYTQMIEYQQYLKASLYNELGLEVNFNMKRERLTEDEVNMVDIIYPFVDNMMMNRQKAIAEINEKYDLEITIGFDSVWAKYQPQEAFDEEGLMDEVDMYLEMLLGPGDMTQGMTDVPFESIEDMSDEQIEAMLVDVSEEELQDLVDELLAIEAEEDNDESESNVSDEGSRDSDTDADEEQPEDGEGTERTGSGDGSERDDTEPGDDNTGQGDESDRTSQRPDAGTTGDDATETTGTTEPTESDDRSTGTTTETDVNDGRDETDITDDTATETDGSESDGDTHDGSDGTDGGATDEDSGEPSDESPTERTSTGPVREPLVNREPTTDSTSDVPTASTHGVQPTQHVDTETEHAGTEDSGQHSDDVEVNVEVNLTIDEDIHEEILETPVIELVEDVEPEEELVIEVPVVDIVEAMEEEAKEEEEKEDEDEG